MCKVERGRPGWTTEELPLCPGVNGCLGRMANRALLQTVLKAIWNVNWRAESVLGTSVSPDYLVAGGFTVKLLKCQLQCPPPAEPLSKACSNFVFIIL